MIGFEWEDLVSEWGVELLRRECTKRREGVQVYGCEMFVHVSLVGFKGHQYMLHLYQVDVRRSWPDDTLLSLADLFLNLNPAPSPTARLACTVSGCRLTDWRGGRRAKSYSMWSCAYTSIASSHTPLDRSARPRHRSDVYVGSYPPYAHSKYSSAPRHRNTDLPRPGS